MCVLKRRGPQRETKQLPAGGTARRDHNRRTLRTVGPREPRSSDARPQRASSPRFRGLLPRRKDGPRRPSRPARAVLPCGVLGPAAPHRTGVRRRDTTRSPIPSPKQHSRLGHAVRRRGSSARERHLWQWSGSRDRDRLPRAGTRVGHGLRAQATDCPVLVVPLHRQAAPSAAPVTTGRRSPGAVVARQPAFCPISFAQNAPASSTYRRERGRLVEKRPEAVC